MKGIVLFDIDGTMLRTRGAGSAALSSALVESFPGAKLPENFNAHGRTDSDIFQEIVTHALKRSPTPEELAILQASYIRHFEKALEQAKHFEVFIGVLELLQTLSEMGNYAIGLQTGNLEATALLKLQRGKLDGFFVFGGYGSDADVREEIIRVAIERGKQRYDLPQESALPIMVIGDSINDIRASKANRALAVGVLTGGATSESLTKVRCRSRCFRFLRLQAACQFSSEYGLER